MYKVFATSGGSLLHSQLEDAEPAQHGFRIVPTNRQKAKVIDPFSHFLVRNASLGYNTDTCNSNGNYAYLNAFPVLADDLLVVYYKWQYVLCGGKSFVGWMSGV